VVQQYLARHLSDCTGSFSLSFGMPLIFSLQDDGYLVTSNNWTVWRCSLCVHYIYMCIFTKAVQYLISGRSELSISKWTAAMYYIFAFT
jgi:Sec-independent protein secretion pathway component TatC